MNQRSIKRKTDYGKLSDNNIQKKGVMPERKIQTPDQDSAAKLEENLLRELKAYYENGCGLKLNGKPCGPEQITKACLREHQDYMRDIVDDERQKIREINFIRIRSL